MAGCCYNKLLACGCGIYSILFALALIELLTKNISTTMNLFIVALTLTSADVRHALPYVSFEVRSNGSFCFHYTSAITNITHADRVSAFFGSFLATAGSAAALVS